MVIYQSRTIRRVPEREVITYNLFSIGDTAIYTDSSTPVIVDWSFLNLGKVIKQLRPEIDIYRIRQYAIVAQLAVSAGIGYLSFYNYDNDVDIVTISTVATLKSNREVVFFNIDPSLLEQEKVFVLRIWNDPGGVGYYTFLGKTELVLFLE